MSNIEEIINRQIHNWDRIQSVLGKRPASEDEPGEEDTISILRGLKERYELHHGVRIADAALVAAATLSHRYISDRFLPTDSSTHPRCC